MTTNSVYIIAEAGVNHDGNRKMAFALIDVAVTADADAEPGAALTNNSIISGRHK